MNKFKLLLIVIIFTALPAYAQSQSVAPIELKAKQAIIIEAATGTTLFEKEADVHMPTSSMSKVMTMYLVFEAIKNGKLKMEDELRVSDNAWKQSGSRTFLKVGSLVKVEDLVCGVIIQSGNDSAVVLAEALGGSEANFAEMMNAKAVELGMKNSHFMNATGLPDPEHYSTARDLATLSIAIMRDFPQHYHFYSEQEFTYNNIKQGNRNPLLYRNIGVDGLKTGHTDLAGFGLIASANRDGRRLVLVVNGLPDMQARADEPATMIEWGYREFGLYKALTQGQKLGDAEVWLGTQPTVQFSASSDYLLSLPKSVRNSLQVKLSFDSPINAPVSKGQIIGKAIVTATGIAPVEVPLVADGSVEKLNFINRIIAKLKLLIGKK